MDLLKTLDLTQYQRSNSNNPVLQRRIKLAADISEQRHLAQVLNCKSFSVRIVLDEVGELR